MSESTERKCIRREEELAGKTIRKANGLYGGTLLLAFDDGSCAKIEAYSDGCGDDADLKFVQLDWHDLDCLGMLTAEERSARLREEDERKKESRRAEYERLKKEFGDA